MSISHGLRPLNERRLSKSCTLKLNININMQEHADAMHIKELLLHRGEVMDVTPFKPNANDAINAPLDTSDQGEVDHRVEAGTGAQRRRPPLGPRGSRRKSSIWRITPSKV